MKLTKICNSCKISKQTSKFYKNKHNNSGVDNTCSKCTQIRNLTRNRTLIGKLKETYREQISSSKTRQMHLPLYTKSELIEIFKDNQNYVSLDYKIGRTS